MESIGKDLTHGYHVYITAMGRGTHYRGKLNKYGFIVQKLKPRAKRIYGFMNGDIVTADVPKISKQGKPYKYSGHYVGRVMTRDSGSFDIRTTDGRLVTVSHEYVRLRQYSDGYQYSQKRTTEKNCQEAS
jgi:ribosomal protein L21E